MSSASLAGWLGASAAALDQMEQAHRAVGGPRRGRRYATQQLNQGYLVLLSSHFQQFCRELHTEATTHLLGALDPALEPIVQSALTQGRKLDSGNPNPGNLGIDFGRLGMTFWNAVNAHHPRNPDRLKRLEEMGAWRNAIAHQHFTSGAAVRALQGRREIRLSEVRGFRSACNGLARSFDTVVLVHIKAIAGPRAGW